MAPGIARKKWLDKRNIRSYNRIYLMKRFVCKPEIQHYSGLVLVSTGVWKWKKPSVAGHYDKSSN